MYKRDLAEERTNAEYADSVLSGQSSDSRSTIVNIKRLVDLLCVMCAADVG